MNFLAHAYFAGGDDNLIVGGTSADLVCARQQQRQPSLRQRLFALLKRRDWVVSNRGLDGPRMVPMCIEKRFSRSFPWRLGSDLVVRHPEELCRGFPDVLEATH